MRPRILKFFSLAIGIMFINGCNSGTGNSSITNQTSNEVVNIDATNSQQYANPNSVNSEDSGLKSADTNCIKAGDLSFSSSSTVWYMSGSFKISNNCSSAQQINGLTLLLTGGSSSDSWNTNGFTINSFTPWLGTAPNYTSSVTANQLSLKINNNYLLAANQSIIVNYGYNRNNKPLTTTGASIVVSSNTPPTPIPSPSPITNPVLKLTVNSSALVNTCNITTPCNITINLLNPNGTVYKTITTLTTNTGSNVYTLDNVTAGNYSLSTSNLPNKVTATFNPTSLQLLAGQTTAASVNFNITNPANNCLTTSMGALNSSAWWLSGSFTITNSCNATQILAGTTITISSNDPSDLIDGFQINGTSPYIANFASVINSSNSALITVNSSSGLVSANGSIIVGFGYSPQGKLLKGSLLATVNGATPVANAKLSVIVDSSALATYCTTINPCNIPVIVSNQAGSFTKTLTTITNSIGKTTFNITGLNPGVYIVSSNLPTDILASYTPAASLQIASGESKVINVSYSKKPATTGILNFSLINPQSSVFALESLPVTITTTGNSNAIQAKFGQLTSATLTAGNYSLSTVGLAFASKGLYYKYPLPNVSISVNNTTSLGNIMAVAESSLINNTVTINGLAKGDSVTLAFADNKYVFNKEIIIATQESLPIISNFKFLDKDQITLNVLTNNNYQSIAPVTLTISPNQNYIITLTKIKQPTQQIVGYFETWMARATWESVTYSLAAIPSYIGIIPLAFAKPDSVYTAGSYNFRGAGLDITATKDVTLGAIKLAQAKGQKLLLSVGGATYPNFAAINISALMALVKDLNLDGIDLDYEADTNGCSNLNTNNLSCPTDSQMINIINQLRSGLDQIQSSTGRKMYLTAAVWSIGAYGTPNYPTSQYGPVGTKSALWVNPLKQVGTKFDMLFLMSYDAGNATTTGYRPLDALKAYKNIYSGPVYLGVEVPPEAWGGNVTTPEAALNNAVQAGQLGGAGTMIWALQLQGTANGISVNSMSYLQPICQLYNLGNCTAPIPLN